MSSSWKTFFAILNCFWIFIMTRANFKGFSHTTIFSNLIACIAPESTLEGLLTSLLCHHTCTVWEFHSVSDLCLLVNLLCHHRFKARGMCWIVIAFTYICVSSCKNSKTMKLNNSVLWYCFRLAANQLQVWCGSSRKKEINSILVGD